MPRKRMGKRNLMQGCWDQGPLTKNEKENVRILEELPDSRRLLAPSVSPFRFYRHTPSPSPFQILDLPAELRNRIYEKLLEGYAKISKCLSPCFRESDFQKDFIIHAQFLSVNQQVYQEYGSFFYGLEVWFHTLDEASIVFARGLPQAPLVGFLRKINFTRTDSLYHNRDSEHFQTLAVVFESLKEAKNLQIISLSHMHVCGISRSSTLTELRFSNALLPFFRHLIGERPDGDVHTVLGILSVKHPRDCCCYVSEDSVVGCGCGDIVCGEIDRLGITLIQHERDIERAVHERLAKALLEDLASHHETSLSSAKSMLLGGDGTELQDDLAFAAAMSRLRGPRRR